MLLEASSGTAEQSAKKEVWLLDEHCRLQQGFTFTLPNSVDLDVISKVGDKACFTNFIRPREQSSCTHRAQIAT